MRSDALHQMGLRNSSTRSFDYVGFQRRWHPLHMLPARFDPKDKKKQGPKALGDQKCFLKNRAKGWNLRVPDCKGNTWHLQKTEFLCTKTAAAKKTTSCTFVSRWVLAPLNKEHGKWMNLELTLHPEHQSEKNSTLIDSSSSWSGWDLVFPQNRQALTLHRALPVESLDAEICENHQQNLWQQNHRSVRESDKNLETMHHVPKWIGSSSQVLGARWQVSFCLSCRQGCSYHHVAP